MSRTAFWLDVDWAYSSTALLTRSALLYRGLWTFRAERCLPDAPGSIEISASMPTNRFLCRNLSNYRLVRIERRSAGRQRPGMAIVCTGCPRYVSLETSTSPSGRSVLAHRIYLGRGCLFPSSLSPRMADIAPSRQREFDSMARTELRFPVTGKAVGWCRRVEHRDTTLHSSSSDHFAC